MTGEHEGQAPERATGRPWDDPATDVLRSWHDFAVGLDVAADEDAEHVRRIVEQLPTLDEIERTLAGVRRRVAALPAPRLTPWQPPVVPMIEAVQAWVDEYVEQPLQSWQRELISPTLYARLHPAPIPHEPSPALVSWLLAQP